ncbi:hypothetical protein GLOIN_2v1846762 [Rhizophagus irregularis DAOM 181602=DAOM 197198]|uniref:Ion transport domain-containing protein n=1 Tax=Rhizophagus irregularis (strain DAOM 181602 / DAOM 197198 / MUCL 43194) TaxID=747089 RepID=A0A2P4P9C7_RHIID|nr:hypothetical protein GLOIN_2v1846762 [Rhizophagus irregularis DAOM 181602=DAOM 197198]POG61974.1 hypothetical protein GLOIN_2v1846762 [Rhizophagus irregularis DAOM 181602=DAOM 197198]|eukprot:XP_025168840.1 hypothetical protein GLOIN_2v1846762 [Rhizophagus irregularis DAOM 181602=DAOM 197198]
MGDYKNINYTNNDITEKKEVYQIEISQNGKFAATFDTANLRIKILQNTDYRPSQFNKKKVNSNNKNEFETIAHFKIKDDFTIEKFYKTDSKDNDHTEKNETKASELYKKVEAASSDSNETTANNEKKGDDQFRWSFDISNMHKNDDKYIVLVAISHTKVDEDMKETKKEKDDKKSDYTRGYLCKKKFKPIDERILQSKNTTIIISQGSISAIPLNESNKGTAIYRIELKKEDGNVEEENYILSAVTCYYSSNISGICNFVEVLNKDNSKQQLYDSELKRFMILNFHGIYNFEFNDHFDFFNLNEKFEYPQNIRHELDNWYTFKRYNDCMRRFLSCICDKYFLIARYKNGAQSLEVYNLEKMEHVTDAKLIENTVDRYNNYIFSVSMLQFCFAQINIIKLFYIENGLQIASKKFNEIERIHLLEFIDSDEKLFIIGEDSKKKIKVIIWDLYNTGKYELMELMELDDFSINIDDIYTHLAITSGNILYVDDKGKVSSVLKKVENKIKDKEDKKNIDKLATRTTDKVENKIKHKEDKKNNDNNKTLEFTNLVYRETCVFSGCGNEYECLYYKKNGTEEEILGLIVGRYTVQIWHQIRDDSKNKDDLPNNGEPFLEYIWSNRIPVNQERERTKLRIENFKCEMNDGPHDELNFRLKIFWFERNDSSKPEEYTKMTEHEIIKEEDDEINFIENKLNQINEYNDLEEKERKRQEIIVKNCVKVKIREKVIQRKDIIKKSHAVRHACKALEHLKKLHKSKNITDNYIYEEMVNYIEHIIWRFAKYEPENFRLLDVRYNLMKRLILCDCDRLIKFILFGDEETAENKIDYRHVPSNKSWPGKVFLKDDDLDFDKRKDGLKENKRIKLENNMELAIYHFRGRELKDAIIVAYLLEYYSRNPTNCVDWMCTVSKAIPLLFEYNYDDFAKKLFVRCFADQCDFSSQDPDEIIPKEYLESHNSDNKFRAFRTMVKLLKSDKCDKYKWYNDWIRAKLISFKTKIFKNYGSFEKSPLALRVVPFPGFTINSIKKQKREYNFFEFISNIILFLFIPRWHRVNRDENFISSFKIRFILLRDPKNMKIKDSTYSGNVTNSSTNETLNIKLKPDFDPASSDNPFSSFITAVEAAYFWINGNWVQKDKFDFWAVDLLTLFASIFLVIILQNILIAFMNGVYLTAGAKGKQRLLRYRASCIVCFEGLYHIRFWNPEPEPKYIHYFSQAKIFGEWYNTRKDYDKNPIYKGFEGMSKFKRRVYKEMDYDKFSILKYWNNNKNTKIIEDFKNVSNGFNDSIENLIKRNEGKSSIDEFEEIYEVKNTLEVEVKKFQLKLEKLRNLKLYES